MRIKTKYFETFKTLFYLLDKNSQKESVKSLIYILISAFLDIFSIATIIPLILLVLNPEIASQNRYFISIISFLNISTINFIRFLLVFIVLFFIVKNLLNIKISEFIAKYTYKIVTEISEKALIKFYISDFQDIANKSSSIIIREIFEAPVDYSYQIIRSIINIFSELIVFFIIIIVVIFVNFKIAILLILIYIPLMYLFYFIKRKKVAEIAQTNKITHNEILKILYNSVKGFTDIRLFNKQSYFIKKYLKNNHSYQKIRSKTFVILEIPRRAVEIIIVLMLILLVVFGKYYIDNNNSLNILISTVIAISYKLLPSLNKTYMNIIKVKTAWYSVEIVKELNNNSIENATGTENENLKFKKSIKLKNFNFSYNDTNQQVFKNLNFDVEKGDFIGIIGKSGSGKTSLLNILSGLIIQDNILKIDDKFLSIKNVKNWYKQIGYVTQNSYIFNGSICENIALGIKKSEINHNKLNDVLALVELDFWAKSLPNGKNTILGENGSKISEGQKQRLALARVLYKKTDLLLLDEITGNLDFETEDSIIKLLEKLNKEGKTIIFVSHRKNTLKNCNKIFKIENYKLNNYEYQL